MTHVSIDRQPEAVKQFFETLELPPEGSVVEMNGRPVARILPANHRDSEWTEAKNERRSDLIEKEIDGTLTPAEAVELQALQQAMLKYRNKVAPLPIAAVRKLHDELLAKAGRAHPAK